MLLLATLLYSSPPDRVNDVTFSFQLSFFGGTGGGSFSLAIDTVLELPLVCGTESSLPTSTGSFPI